MDHLIPILKRPDHKLMDLNGHDVKTIYIAVATTGLSQVDEICQIAAMVEDDESPWSIDILPNSKEFTPHASVYNGYTSRIGTDRLKHLFKDGVKIETCTLYNGLLSFMRYVMSKANNSTHNIVLIGWNSQKFHVPLLLRALKHCRLSFQPLEDSGVCYGDPYIMIKQTRELFPQLSEVSSLSLPVVHQHLYTGPGNDFNPYDARNIVQMLKSVILSLKVTKESLINCSFTFSSAESVRKYRYKVKRNLASMERKLYKRGRSDDTRGFITESMAKKIAESGLKYQDLKKIYRRCGREGIETCLKAPLPQKLGEHRAKPRVTRCQRVIDTIVSHFEQRKSQRKRST